MACICPLPQTVAKRSCNYQLLRTITLLVISIDHKQMTKHNSSSVNGNQMLCTPSGNSKLYRVCFWSFPKNLVIKNDRSVSYYNFYTKHWIYNKSNPFSVIYCFELEEFHFILKTTTMIDINTAPMKKYESERTKCMKISIEQHSKLKSSHSWQCPPIVPSRLQ